MASAHLEDVGSWFLGSLEPNKCYFMRFVSNVLNSLNGKIYNLFVYINWWD